MPVMSDPETGSTFVVRSALHPKPFGRKIRCLTPHPVQRHFVAWQLRKHLTARAKSNLGDLFDKDLSYGGVLELANLARQTVPFPGVRDGALRLVFYLSVAEVGVPLVDAAGPATCKWLVLVTSLCGHLVTVYPAPQIPYYIK